MKKYTQGGTFVPSFLPPFLSFRPPFLSFLHHFLDPFLLSVIISLAPSFVPSFGIPSFLLRL
jgi:hypothetical protein